jgi:rare lipoprotein A
MHDTVIRFGRLVYMCLVIVLLVACSGGARRGGGYYLDDGPDANPPANLDAVPDAVPKLEPFAPSNSKPYVVFGKTYTPDVSGGPYKVQGRASWYGKKFHGQSTANGERYNMYGMTAAHPTLPLPSYARVTRASNGKSVVVRVNDRGPFLNDRVIDLSYVAAYKLGMLGPGSAEVVVERITPDQIRNWQSAPAALNVAATASAPAPTAATPDSMYLQLGAFSDASKARALATRIQSQIPAELIASVRVEQMTNNLHRVRIGPFASREAAVQAINPVQTSTGVAPSLSPP